MEVKPPPSKVFAIICEDGSVYPDDGSLSENREYIDEILEEIASSGGECDCSKPHRVVTYILTE